VTPLGENPVGAIAEGGAQTIDERAGPVGIVEERVADGEPHDVIYCDVGRTERPPGVALSVDASARNRYV